MDMSCNSRSVCRQHCTLLRVSRPHGSRGLADHFCGGLTIPTSYCPTTNSINQILRSSQPHPYHLSFGYNIICGTCFHFSDVSQEQEMTYRSSFSPLLTTTADTYIAQGENWRRWRRWRSRTHGLWSLTGHNRLQRGDSDTYARVAMLDSPYPDFRTEGLTRVTMT